MSSEFIKSLCAFDSLKISISGIRGIYGNDLGLKDIIFYCRNFSHLITSKKCVIAQDTRPSSNIVANVAMAALMERGVSIYDLGISPTPVAFRESRKHGAGVIITSSHNPLEWNGLKFIIEGRGINESELDILTKKNHHFQKEKIGKEFQIKSTYIDDAVELIGDVKRGSVVALDVGGGAAFEVAPNLLKKLGCKTNTINSKPGKSTRGPDPTYDQLKDLRLATKKSQIGFAFDLDGDRLVVVKDGKKQTPDVTLGLGVASVINKGYKKYVLSIDTSIGIEKFIEGEGGKVRRSKVGEANVVDLMIQTNAQAGGEGSSAGFILPEFNMCRDGLLTSGLIISMLETGQLDETIKFMEKYHQVRTKVSVDSRFHKKTLKILMNKIKGQFSEIVTIDGIKAIIDDNSWTLVRQSNTEHIIRVSCESNDLSKAKSIEKQITKLVNQSYEEARRDRNN